MTDVVLQHCVMLGCRWCKRGSTGMGHRRAVTGRENAGELHIRLQRKANFLGNEDLQSTSILSLLQVVMFVYDITNYSSFENLDDWLAIVKRECSKADTRPPHFALVANKSEWKQKEV